MTQQQTYKGLLIKDLLEKLGNVKPNRRQATFAEKFVLRTALNREITFNTQLTEKEICCLYWAAQGCSTRTTAHIMREKQATIESYRKEIKRKLQCNTIAQAVYEGICFGYMPPKCHKKYPKNRVLTF
jgi:DNA-binding CsgD family transcriptional regulator